MSDSGNTPKLSYSPTAEMGAVRSLNDNTGQDILMITQDRARLVLTNWKSRMERRWLWVTPITLFVSLLAVLSTSKFQPVFGIQAEDLRGFFVGLTALSGMWGLAEVVICVRNRGTTIETIVAQMDEGGRVQRFESAAKTMPGGEFYKPDVQ